jgi:predicted HAD superfamily Cof-like phosphohydrolase
LTQSNFDDVGDFHRKFDLPTSYDGPAEFIGEGAFKFRYGFLQEELREMKESHDRGDLAGVADALADLVYVALGTAHMYRIPFDEVFAAVQEANMKKERASSAYDERSKRGSSLDVVKPKGWTPPDIQAILDEHKDNFPE